MNTLLYSELFEYFAFPVFALSFSGVVSYKNEAANKYLPMLRKNACVKKHFYPAEIPQEGGVLRIVGDTPYHIALALKDENGLLAICFSRFQYEDGIQIARRLLQRFGNTADTFLSAFQNETANAYTPYSGRIYTDIFAVIEDKDDLLKGSGYSFSDTVSLLFEQTNDAFGALGYRICARIEQGFLSKKAVRFHFHDFLFLFGRLLYMQMRLSENGDVSVSLTSDAKEHIFRFCAKTEKISYPLTEDDVYTVISRAVPECAVEFALLQKAGMLCADRLKLYYDPFGCFTAEYRIPYFESTALSVKSVEFSRLLLAKDIERFLAAFTKRLKDNGASC